MVSTSSDTTPAGTSIVASPVTMTEPSSERVRAATVPSRRTASTAASKSVRYRAVISASLANRTSTRSFTSDRNSSRYRSTQNESDRLRATRLPAERAWSMALTMASFADGTSHR